MTDSTHDSFDRAILSALQRDGALTNAQLSEIVNLSPSQCSRRRVALERAGVIRGYAARLDGRMLGFGMRAFARVNLRSHGAASDKDFASFIADSSASVSTRSLNTRRAISILRGELVWIPSRWNSRSAGV